MSSKASDKSRAAEKPLKPAVGKITQALGSALMTGESLFVRNS